MDIRRTENTKRNIVFGTLNKIVTLFLPFILRTVMIRTIGAEYLGLNSLFSSILQVLNLTELGFSSAIVYCMYKPIAENDNETVCALYGLFKKIYRRIGIFILICGGIITPFLPRLIRGELPSDINIYIVFSAYLLNTAATYMLYAYKSSIPNAMQRADIVNIVSTLSIGGMYITQILVLIILKNFYIYITLMPIFTVANNLILSYTVDKMFPCIRCYGVVSDEMKSKIKSHVSGLMISKLCQTTRNALDSICVSMFLGLTMTAMYNNYYYVINALIGFSTVITGSMTAGVGNSSIKESREKNYFDMRRINFIYMWISGWATICLLCLYQPFMEIWMGKDYLFSYGVVIAFSVYFYALKMGDIRGLYSDANGLWWENRYRAIAESITNILLNILLGKLLGVYGIILATLISLLIINFGLGSQIIFKYYFKNGKIYEYFTDHFKYALTSSIAAFLTVLVCNTIKGNICMVLITRMAICCIIPNGLYLFIYQKTTQYEEAIPWLLEKIGFRYNNNIFGKR